MRLKKKRIFQLLHTTIMLEFLRYFLFVKVIIFLLQIFCTAFPCNLLQQNVFRLKTLLITLSQDFQEYCIFIIVNIPRKTFAAVGSNNISSMHR